MSIHTLLGRLNRMRNVLVASFLVFGAHVTSHGATYYVSTTGNDGNDGLTAETAKASIAGACALASDSDADTIEIAAGDYSLSAAITIAKPCIVTSANGNPESVRINCAGEFASFTIANATARLRGVTLFSDNDNTTSTNAVHISEGTLDSCIISNFHSSAAILRFSGSGGRIYTLTNCVVTGCRFSGANGPARMIDCNVRGLLVTHCRFVGNSVEKNGYLLFANRNNVIRNCLIADNVNSGSLTDGFIISAYNNNDSSFQSCTIAGNRTTKEGGTSYSAVKSNISSTTFVNCILWGNATPDGDYRDLNALEGQATYCCSSTPGLDGTGCTTSYPKFEAASNGNYRLKPSSPCINAGLNQSWMASATDLDGNARIYHEKTVDMGCYEFSSPSAFRVTVR